MSLVLTWVITASFLQRLLVTTPLAVHSQACECLKQCHHAHSFVQGLLVKMITGDQALIGRETAKQLGMGSNIFNTEVLLKVRTALFAQVTWVPQC